MTFILSNHIGLPKALEDYSNKGLQIGLAGLLINGIIFALELISGLSANNAALLTDAFHNLTDSVFGAVTVLSFWIMNRPGTARYPFGFGRVEYLGSFFLGMLMIGTGAYFAAVSLGEILHPAAATPGLLTFTLILFSLLLKLAYGFLTCRYAKESGSSVLKAGWLDALIDAAALGAIAVSALLARTAQLQTDGWIGLVISGCLLWSGGSVWRPAVRALVGQEADPAVFETIQSIIQEDAQIKGYHDLVIHDYGVGKTLASVHVEIPAGVSLVRAHEIAACMEQHAQQESIYLTVHVDPVR